MGAPPPFMTNMGPPPHPGGRVDFNGLNYVSTQQRRGPRMTTYGEWTQSRGRRRHSSSPLREEAVPSVIKSPRSKSSSKDGSQHQATAGSGLHSRGRPRTKRNSNATQQNQQQPQQVAADPQHYLRIHQHSSSANTTQLQPQPPDGATGLGSRLSHQQHHEVNVLNQQLQQRMEHSRSPSDGMILTASGLSGLLSNSGAGVQGHIHSRIPSILQQNAQNIGNNSENHNSNQVVIVDGLNNDEDVYLTTSWYVTFNLLLAY